MKRLARWIAGAAAATALGALAQPTVPITIAKLGTGDAYVVASQGSVCRIPCTFDVASGSDVSVRIVPEINSSFRDWMLPCVGLIACTGTNITQPTTVHAIVEAGRRNGLAMEPEVARITLPNVTWGNVGDAVTFRLRNDNASPVTIGEITGTPPFEITSQCLNSVLATGQSCQVSVRINSVLHPAEQPGIKGVSLVVNTNAPFDPVFFVDAAGFLEGDVVLHFYRAILGRDPDAGGKAFWNAEAQRVRDMGVNVNFVWQALAVQLFGSTEYATRGVDARQTLEHMYTTFLLRASDTAGADYYMTLANAAMPFEGWIPAFGFSGEFAQLTSQQLAPGPSSRPEAELVMDLYRGTLRRLPDSAGFAYWVGQFRAAQCNGAEAVRATADLISGFFLNSPEYQQHYSLPDYITHLYDAFMRRTPDLGGWNYWYGALSADSSPRARERARTFFVNSPEFQSRVQAVLAAGCLR